jgi:UDP-galactopyranose mutase
VNYPEENFPYTRSTEWNQLLGDPSPRKLITYEFPQADGDPYYPIPRPENEELYQKYKLEAQNTPNVFFCGRLGTYRYYNMDQCVAQALKLAEELKSLR